MGPRRGRDRSVEGPTGVEAEPLRPAADQAALQAAGEADLVFLIHAPSAEEAERYRRELLAHGIPAAVDDGWAGPWVGFESGVPVFVPATLADIAAEHVAELEFGRPEETAVVDEDDVLDETDDLEDLPDEDLDDDIEDLDDEDLDDDWDEDEDEWDDEDDWEDEDEY